ncbi:hypothetical protein EKN09_06625 [Vibrio penaeicida]|nr:hypothetical protein EKN09_06625 [Vibrio penaeicida]
MVSLLAPAKAATLLQRQYIQGTPTIVTGPLSDLAIEINSADDSMIIPHTEAIATNAAEFSVGFWMKLTEGHNGVWRSIMQKGSSANERTIAMWMRPVTGKVITWILVEPMALMHCSQTSLIV